MKLVWKKPTIDLLQEKSNRRTEKNEEKKETDRTEETAVNVNKFMKIAESEEKEIFHFLYGQSVQRNIFGQRRNRSEKIGEGGRHCLSSISG